MDDPIGSTKRPRKRLRLTLGVLMALVFVLCGALAWVADGARRQRLAVAAILRHGGTVTYDSQPEPPQLGVQNPKAKTSRAPKWLRDALGADAFDSAIFASVRRPDDAVMSHVAKLDRLRGLLLIGHGPGLTAKGLDAIGSLPRLEALQTASLGDAGRGFRFANLAGKTHLRRLIDYDLAPTDDDLNVIGGLTGLEILMIDGRQVTDAGLARLAGLTRLQTLHLADCTISTLAPFAGMANLESLGFERPGTMTPTGTGRATVSTIAPLLNLKKLQSINLGPNAVDDAGLAGIESMTSLIGLDAHDRVSDEGLERIAALPKLTSLTLRGPSVTPDRLATVARMPLLSGLALTDTPIRDLAPLAPMTGRLRDLSVYTSPLTDDSLKPLANAARLRSMVLTGTEVTGAGLSNLPVAARLILLQLSGPSINDDALAQIPRLTGLSNLYLSDVRITDAGLSLIAPAASLKRLTIRNTSITDAAVPFLSRRTAPLRIFLSGTRLTEDGLRRLKAIPKLQIVDVTGSPP